MTEQAGGPLYVQRQPLSITMQGHVQITRDHHQILKTSTRLSTIPEYSRNSYSQMTSRTPQHRTGLTATAPGQTPCRGAATSLSTARRTMARLPTSRRSSSWLSRQWYSRSSYWLLLLVSTYTNLSM